MEIIEELDTQADGKEYLPIIPAPYRWRDWANNPTKKGLSGDELIAFIQNDEAHLPNGERGLGLIAALKDLRNQTRSEYDRRLIIANVFKDTFNRMVNGALLRDIIDLLNNIHFDSSEEVHIMGDLYENLLQQMRDSAGSAGEFYTPRAVVRFMVERINPQIGETIEDFACGTGGFLVEAFKHLYAKAQQGTVEQRNFVQREAIHGNEVKPLPYLLAQMNLLLHGMESPRIEYDNSLRKHLKDITSTNQVDIILANPPFGGQEEKSILKNFPDFPTSETALLFLQLIMRKLRKNGKKAGRAAIVIPNGTLFGDGLCAKIKEQLLKECHLHTIVRLPNGVFAPYTSIPTNLLFFDTSKPTDTIWYYELPLPEGRKTYTKTKPLQYADFADCQTWWDNRSENDHAWQYDFKQALATAKQQAQPHKDKATQATLAADNALAAINLATESLKTVEKGSVQAKSGLQQIADLKQQELEQRAIAKEEQAKAEAIYWAVFNLDQKNPSTAQDFEHLPPEQLVAGVIEKEQRILQLMAEIQQSLVVENTEGV
jgi:type I restriction enzyme M protein